jgi:hypothetical protein
MLFNFLVHGVRPKLEDRGQLGNIMRMRGLVLSPVNYALQGTDKESNVELHSANFSER